MNSLWQVWQVGADSPGKGFTLQAGQRWASNLKSNELCISGITENKLEQPPPHPIFKALWVPKSLYPLFWELQWLCWAVVAGSVCIFYIKLVTGMVRLDNTGERWGPPPFRWRSLNIPSFSDNGVMVFWHPKLRNSQEWRSFVHRGPGTPQVTLSMSTDHVWVSDHVKPQCNAPSHKNESSIGDDAEHGRWPHALFCVSLSILHFVMIFYLVES